MAILVLASSAFLISVRAQLHALDYDTPSYIDFEAGELTTPEGASLIVNIYRTGDFRRSSRISYTTREITASEGQDYAGTGGTLTFQPGESKKELRIAIQSDNQAESDETFQLLLSDPGPYTVITRNALAITIHDAPNVSVPALEIATAGTRRISLAWNGSPEYTVERTISAGSGEWVEFPCTPSVNGKRCEVIVDANGPLYLYRLRSPAGSSESLGN